MYGSITRIHLNYKESDMNSATFIHPDKGEKLEFEIHEADNDQLAFSINVGIAPVVTVFSEKYALMDAITEFYEKLYDEKEEL